MKRFIVLILSLLFVYGCGPRYILKSDPPSQKVNTDSYSIELYPTQIILDGYTAFGLIIENKTQNNIEIIWDKTYYLYNEATNGGFMFEGIVYKDRNNSKPPDIIFPKTKFQKTIWPNIFVRLSQYGWLNDTLPMGDNGVYITLNVDGKEKQEKLTVNLSRKIK